MCGTTVEIQSATTENRRGKRRKKEETTAAKYNGLPYWAATKKLVLVREGSRGLTSLLFHLPL